MGVRTAQETWEAALGELQVQVSKSNYRTWFQKTTGLSYGENQFIIGVPNTFVAEYLEKNQRSLIEKALIGLTSPDIQVAFHVNGKQKQSPDTSGAELTIQAATKSYSHSLNQKYVFESFIEGSCNRLAYAAALAVAHNPENSYNPLFIYGGVGLGKTHLLHAIGHVALSRHIPVICVSAEQFTNEFVTAVREKKTEEFRSKYRSAGMLLIDDIQFISGKEQTEESFFHTFNELHNANRQIVITSDRLPKSIPGLEAKLCSRFDCGLVADIQPPDFETRLAILQAKAAQREENINLDTLKLIAQKILPNIRELEGSLNRVVAFSKLLGAAPTIGIAARALEDIASKEPADNTITPGLLLKATADSFQLTPADLTGPKRDKETILARRVAMYLARQETNHSLAQIGQELGGRDAAAVTVACKRIASDIDTTPFIKRKIQDIEQKIHKNQKFG